MFKRMSVVSCGVAVALMTAGAASAQTATQEAKAKTASAAQAVGTVLTDAEITTAVKTKLLGDKAVGGLKIDVDTEHGVVTLTGPVHSAAERAEALRLARTTKGVKSVVNKLVMDTVATTGRVDKAEPKETTIVIKDDATPKVKEAAKKTADVTKEAAKKTESAAKTAGSATEKAAKDTGANITDAAITSEVKTKFLADTKVAGLAINVDTNDHVVTLTGTVKSAAEKAEAIRLAKTTKGVSKVVDKLVIQ